MEERHRLHHRPATLWIFVLLGISALLPRVIGLGLFVTSDEANFWLTRSSQFLEAIRTGDFPATAISTHPGVTTMWLGATGILLRQQLLNFGLISDGFATRLALMQLPVAVAHTLAILVGYWLLRKLFSSRTALLAALLWALDPVLIGFSRLLHVDALTASFSTLSLLAALVYWNHQPQRRWLLISGVAAGLAMLSKSPALALIPTMLGISWLARRDDGSIRQTWWVMLRPLLLWGIVCLATIILGWPTLWSGPADAIRLIRLGVEAEGAQPHMLGNFFLGQADAAPGPLFYPVALALRLTPWALLGLLLLPLALWPSRIADTSTAIRLRISRRDLAGLALFVIIFVVALTPFPKKFNRYIVPVMPALDILAAWGLCWVAEQLAAILRWKSAWLVRVVGAGAVAAATAAVIWWHPTELDYANPLFGGYQTAADTFTVGWGEGLSTVADWLNAQPDITGVLVASTQVPTLQPYLRQGAQAVTPAATLPDKTGYVVIYLRDVQGGVPWPPFDAFYQKQTPVAVIEMLGVDLAWIYQVPPAVDTEVNATFGDSLTLRGFSQITPLAPGTTATFHLFWATASTPSENYSLFAHLIGPDGQRYSQVDLSYDTSTWGTLPYHTTELSIPIPAELPQGDYHLVIGMYHPDTGERLTLSDTTVAATDLSGPDGVLLVTTALSPASH